MKLIGSRTGAYEFWIRFPCRFKVWLGQRPNSDIDIAIDIDEPEPISTNPLYSVDVFRGKPLGPYIENGKLYNPDGYSYLLYPLSVKAFKNNWSHLLIYPVTTDVLDAEENKVAELLTDFTQCQDGHLCRLLANKQRSAAKKILPRDSNPFQLNTSRNPDC
jgi:hypothetical protein